MNSIGYLTIDCLEAFAAYKLFDLCFVIDCKTCLDPCLRLFLSRQLKIHNTGRARLIRTR